MIYVRGDTHGDLSCFSDPALSVLGPGDKLIITGDFGFVFVSDPVGLDALAEKPYEILFVDGNHENFEALEAYPQILRYCAPVQQLKPNVFWLRRGYVYTMEGKTFFVMGGGYSIDKAWRMKYEAAGGAKIWFEDELPSAEEYRRAIGNLRERDMKVDCILTHTAPRTIIPRVIGRAPDPHEAELNGFLDWVYHEADFRKWYFGHLHVDMEVNDQMTACFETVRKIGE